MMTLLQNTALFQQACLINGKWQTSTGNVIAVHNPFDGQFLGSVPALSSHDVQKAIGYAKASQKSWANQSAHQRSQILQQWAKLIDDNCDDLATIMTLEQGKPIKESKSEIAYANSFIRWFAEEAKRLDGDVLTSKSSQQRYLVLKQPIGVCAAITPWNFPAAMITRKVAPALASGCTMLLKPASQTPFTALALAYLGQVAGLPDGVLQVITGHSSEIGSILSKDPRIAKLSFTGSTATGKKLMAECADSLKKLSLELGGNAPFIVFEDANLDKAVDGLIASKFRNAGQTCVCANRIYIQNTIKEIFIDKLVNKVQQLKLGNGLHPDTDISTLINQQAVEKTQFLLKDALDKGAKLILGGNPSPVGQYCFEPTIITNLTSKMLISHEEIFAPIVPIFGFDDEDEVLTLANDSDFGLASYFYTQDYALAWRMSEQLEYGMVAQNTGLLSNEVAPFGGIKQSGFGREGSKYGLDEYTTLKYWCVDLH